MKNTYILKTHIRKDILKKRDNIPYDIKIEKDAAIKQRLFNTSEFISAKTICFYASFRTEVDTIAMIEEAQKIGKVIVLPKVDRVKHRLLLYKIKGVKKLVPGYMGIPEPSAVNDKPVDFDEVDLVIVPGIAFDKSGNRVGYGGGYYDILLSESNVKIPIIAVAYEEQIVDSIPSEPHDVRVDMIVTDRRVIKI